MRIGITDIASALIGASVVLIAAILCSAPACAQPSKQEQEEQFVALLEADEIPLIDNLPSLVAQAHQICQRLDGGASVYTLVDEEVNGILDDNPAYRAEAARVHRTAVRFIAVSAEVYCPSHLNDPYVTDDA